MTETDSTPIPRWRHEVGDEIYDHVFGHLDGEVGGVLVGATDEDGNSVVNAAIPALRADGHRASVTFTHEAWAEVHEAMDRHYSDQKIVGWYHSHPGFGIFLSEHDLFIHRNFFTDPRQVAFVIDPYTGKQGIFGWSDGEVVKLHESRTSRRAERPPTASDEVQSRAKPAPSRWRTPSLCFLLGVVLGLVLWLVVLNPVGSTSAHKRSAPAGRASQQHHHGEPVAKTKRTHS